MNFHTRDVKHYQTLKSTASHVLELLSDTIGVNTFFLATNDKSESLIVSAFNRQATYFVEG
ncbi:MAG: hypothetical protein Q8906_10500, partial [Bacillota bacterium]|nr:hypothetical protein [Bacillota bacterium]